MISRMAFLSVLALSAGCVNQQHLYKGAAQAAAVTTGDFDDVVLPLDRISAVSSSYEGLISVATWDANYDATADQLKVEGLLGDINEMTLYQVVIVASGTRGLGSQQYNGLNADNQLVSDPNVIENMQKYVELGNTLVVTDWAYDLVEAAWPDEIDWLGDDTAFDDAQHGDIGSISADITDDTLKTALNEDKFNVDYDFSNWAIPQSTNSDVTVWIQGDVTYTIRDGNPSQPQAAAPLLMSFQPNGKTKGKVVVSTFHWDAQTPQAMDTILTTTVGDFKKAPNQSAQIQ